MKNILSIFAALIFLSTLSSGEENLPELSRTSALLGLKEMPSPIVIITCDRADENVRKNFESTVLKFFKTEFSKLEFPISDKEEVNGIRLIIQLKIIIAPSGAIAMNSSFEFFEQVEVEREGRRYNLNANVKSNNVTSACTSETLDAEFEASFEELSVVTVRQIRGASVK